MAKKKLSQAGREDVALALIFLRDFKCDGKFDVDVIKGVIELAEYLGVRSEYNMLQSKIPPMKIAQRY